jgi:hypothetical protein
MARNAKQKRTSASEVDLDEEIWKTIRHLDPDRGLRKSDIVLGAAWVLCVICFAYSSSRFTIETNEHRQVASTSGGATNAYSRGPKSVGTFNEPFPRGGQRHIVPLSEARRAHELSQSGHTQGKIALRVSNIFRTPNR